MGEIKRKYKLSDYAGAILAVTAIIVAAAVISPLLEETGGKMFDSVQATKGIFKNLDSSSLTIYVIVAALGTLLIGLYIGGKQEDSSKKKTRGSGFVSIQYMQRKIEDVREEVLSKLTDFENIGELKRDFRKLFHDQVDAITKESIITEVTGQFGKEILSKTRMDIVDDEFQAMKKRIALETGRITRYAMINLLIGFVTTFFVIVFLAYSLLGVKTQDMAANEYIMHFIPRLSLSILIEIFSFFFLKLYGKNLEDIKYWNNERTNLEMKIIAIKAAFLSDDKKIIGELVKTISTTERNFILKKGETTVELEKNKLTETANTNIVGTLLKLLDVSKAKA
jgi:hypothetical protein